MRNWAHQNEKQLRDSGHYVRCPSDGRLNNVHVNRSSLEKCLARDSDCYIVFAGHVDIVGDFYAIPGRWLWDRLPDNTLSDSIKGPFWQIDIDRESGTISVGVGDNKTAQGNVNEFNGRAITLG